jgi:hypothetical protein
MKPILIRAQHFGWKEPLVDRTPVGFFANHALSQEALERLIDFRQSKIANNLREEAGVE